MAFENSTSPRVATTHHPAGSNTAVDLDFLPPPPLADCRRRHTQDVQPSQTFQFSVTLVHNGTPGSDDVDSEEGDRRSRLGWSHPKRNRPILWRESGYLRCRMRGSSAV